MTREQTIKWLKDMLKNFDLPQEQYQTALDMAIKALEHPERNVVAIDAIESAKAAMATDGEIYVAKINAEMNIQQLPSVTQKPETVTEFADRCRECGKRYIKRQAGHWIGRDASGTNFYGKCSCCGQEIQIDAWYTQNMNYCPNCGCRMVEPQESEET